jgi:hypothetical protein
MQAFQVYATACPRVRAMCDVDCLPGQMMGIAGKDVWEGGQTFRTGDSVRRSREHLWSGPPCRPAPRLCRSVARKAAPVPPPIRSRNSRRPGAWTHVPAIAGCA